MNLASMKITDTILKKVDEYYTEKVLTHGVTPAGVDWNGETGQELRFDQLLKIISCGENFTLSDIGCGYGRLFSYLKEKGYRDFSYIGLDVSQEMIKQAKILHGDQGNAHFFTGSTCPEETDYCTASGIFNVKLDHNKKEWESFIIETMNQMNLSSRKGFSCNFLTSYSDSHLMKDYLYYADPFFYFDYCKKNFSRHVSLIHDYNLYEFTLLIRKDIS